MKKKKISEKKMPLLGHLKELRVRLLRSFVVTILVFLVCYFFRDDLLKILKDPSAATCQILSITKKILSSQ